MTISGAHSTGFQLLPACLPAVVIEILYGFMICLEYEIALHYINLCFVSNKLCHISLLIDGLKGS